MHAPSDAAEASLNQPRTVFLSVGAGGMALGVFVLAAADASGGAARNASATLVGLAEGTIMAAWTATVRQAFGAARFGTHVAVYNSAIALGSATVQVSQGRQPCWKLAAHTAEERMAYLFQKTGRTGWYYRVLEPGSFAAGDVLMLEERATDAVSLREYWDLHAATRPDLAAVQRVVDAAGLAPDKRARWQQRLEWLRANG